MVDVVSPNDTLPPGLYETWLVMEYCDRGSLTDAINSGRFLSAATRELDQVSVMLSLLDIAHGMEYLHGISMVHGDLKGRNVLLKTARIDRRGFVCKLADFGLSRMLGQEQTHVNTQSYGTATHASPELLRHGKLGPAADVYAFGIIAWEIVAGEEAYSDLTAIQILVQVSQHDLRPPIPDTCPTPLANLMQQCWATDPMDRPTFPSVVRMLSEMLRDCRRAMERARSEPVHTAAASRPSP